MTAAPKSWLDSMATTLEGRAEICSFAERTAEISACLTNFVRLTSYV